MLFFTPRYIKQGRQFVKDARKLVAYKRDISNPEDIAAIEKEIHGLELAVKSKDKTAIAEQAMLLDKTCGRIVKPSEHSGIAENLEVLLVAIVVALGVRTYFLQPFTIPTGSMQPTLNGIVFHPTEKDAPNILTRTLQGALYGRHYVDIVAKEREGVAAYRPVKSILPFVGKVPGLNFGFFQRTEIETLSETGKRRTYIVKEAFDTVTKQVGIGLRGQIFEPGDTILRGYFDAGDHVFVDKMSYHFRTPRRGETFVFSTANIPRLTAPGTPSQYYIKRLVGLPGDTLQIKQPQLFVNGKCAEEETIRRVMQGTYDEPKDGYRGYGNFVGDKGYDQARASTLNYLNHPDASVTLGKKEYFALGDNSFNSLDGRDWGTVPERNIMGRALLVYWPFLPHFGLTK